MQRREFAALAAASLGLVGLPALAAGATPKAGSEYLVLSKPAPTEAPAGKVEVVEFFSYNCPHCAAFEPQLEAWLKRLPAGAVFRRIPVPFVGNDVETKQRLYYALEAMGKVDELQPQIFKAIHTERQPLFGDAAVQAWVEKQPGLDGKKFAELFKSFGVVSKAKRASQMTDLYKVTGVPALGVAGRWYVDGETAGSLGRALEITEYLIAQAGK